jgi:hypothetical protein
MIDFHARCEVCMKDIFQRDQVKAYGLRDRKPYPMELGNASGPWCGVRCICLDCIGFIVNLAMPHGTTIEFPDPPFRITDPILKPQDAPGRDDDDWMAT